MTMLVTALFDKEGEARQALDALDVAGFACLNLMGEEGKEGESFTLEPDLLIEKGVDPQEAQDLVEEVSRGRALVVTSCSRGRREALFEILEQFELSQVSITESESPVESRVSAVDEDKLAGATIDEPIREDLPGGRAMREQFQRADSERLIGEGEVSTSGLSRQAYGSGEERTMPPAPAVASDPSGRFEQFEPEFRRHYEDHLSRSSLTFEEATRGYRYGLILAEHGGFSDRSWENVEPFARRGWESQNQLEWNLVRQAVQKGWQVIVGDQSVGMGRPGV